MYLHTHTHIHTHTHTHTRKTRNQGIRHANPTAMQPDTILLKLLNHLGTGAPRLDQTYHYTTSLQRRIHPPHSTDQRHHGQTPQRRQTGPQIFPSNIYRVPQSYPTSTCYHGAHTTHQRHYTSTHHHTQLMATIHTTQQYSSTQAQLLRHPSECLHH